MLEPRNDAFWEQKCLPDAFHIENALSYDLFSYILNHSNGSIKVISANIFRLKVTLETLEKCMKYLQSYAQNWASIWATLSVLTFLTAGPKCVYTCTKNFCVNTSFSLVFRFLDNMKSLKQSPGDLCILILSLTYPQIA